MYLYIIPVLFGGCVCFCVVLVLFETSIKALWRFWGSMAMDNEISKSSVTLVDNMVIFLGLYEALREDT